jgi:hypothetical protein
LINKEHTTGLLLTCFFDTEANATTFVFELFHVSVLQMVQHLANHGANSIWEHSLLDPSQSKHGKKKPGPRDQVQ